MLLVEPIEAFEDNYIWLLHRQGRDAAVVVDPGDEGPVLKALKAKHLRLTAILITHKHGDHTGGVKALVKRFPGIPVYGPTHEAASGVTHPLKDGEEITLPELDCELWVMDVPGHTEGHIAFVGDGLVFCGDALFSSGCGRVFTGDFEAMAASLHRLAQLPPETQVYCAHEYTMANLGFAALVEPHSATLAARRALCEQARAAGHPTLPSTIALELAANPFLRTNQPEVIAAAERWTGQPLNTPAAVFRALRTWKDQDYD